MQAPVRRVSNFRLGVSVRLGFCSFIGEEARMLNAWVTQYLLSLFAAGG